MHVSIYIYTHIYLVLKKRMVLLPVSTLDRQIPFQYTIPMALHTYFFIVFIEVSMPQSAFLSFPFLCC